MCEKVVDWQRAVSMQAVARCLCFNKKIMQCRSLIRWFLGCIASALYHILLLVFFRSG